MRNVFKYYIVAYLLFISFNIECYDDCIKPDKIIARSFKEGIRIKCPIYSYPLFPQYKGGDASIASNFEPILQYKRSNILI